MTDAADEEMVNTIITRVTEHVDARIDELAAMIRLAAAGVTQTIQQTDTRTGPPGHEQPPPALHEACNADPATGPRRIVMDVAGRTVTEYVTPGDDPAAVWARAYAAVTSHADPAEAGAWRN